ncbi:MAG: flagellar basal body-associated FliL family protein [Desulfovibrionales bacterium]|nr:flagellar basal body-associated FliL family protein [Desulfovibrionales bacterium]
MAEDPNTPTDVIGREKAQLDVGTLAPSVSDKPAKDDKVELDLDDAPFLADDEEDEEADAPEAVDTDPFSNATQIADDPDKAAQKKRTLVLAGIALVAFAIMFSGWWVLKPAETPPKPVTRIVKKQKDAPVAPLQEAKETFEVAWEPFWVEQKNDKGEFRFLVCKFAVYTENEKLSWEAQNKKVTLRDAIFYYLRNKSLKDLSDKENVQLLKSDLLQVVNQYMGNGQFKDVFIENYLVK